MTAGQGWLQLGELLLAFVLSGAVGLEREMRHKSAGLRTYTLVGVSAALFVLVSKYGFNSVLDPGRVVLDPSRVAAQVVSGIGFIGGGVIFMRRNIVRGLTTAASVWLVAAVGMACGSGLPVLAVAATAGYFVVVTAFPALLGRFLPSGRRAIATLHIHYQDRGGRLRAILLACSDLRFAIDRVEVERAGAGPAFREEAADLGDREGDARETRDEALVELVLQVRGKRPVEELVARLGELDGVVRVGTVDDGDVD